MPQARFGTSAPTFGFAMDTHQNKKRRKDDVSLQPHSDAPHALYHGEVANPVDSRGSSKESGYIVVHRVECNRTGHYHQHHEPMRNYFDIPYLPANSNRLTVLHGQEPLGELENYLEDHPNLSFILYMTHSCQAYHEDLKNSFKRLAMPQMDDSVALQAKPYFYVLQKDAPPTTPSSEKLALSEGLDQALEVFFKTSNGTLDTEDREQDEEEDTLRIWRDHVNLTYPYLELYQRNGAFREEAERHTLPGNPEVAHLQMFSRYLDERLGPVFAEAEALFGCGLTDREHWAKLFPPGEVIVTHEHGEPQAYVCTSYPTTIDGALRVKCWSWVFDGKFFKNEAVLVVSWPSDSDKIAITDLHTYPLKHAHGNMEQEMKHRGEVFWACRFRKFVNYDVALQGMEVQKVECPCQSIHKMLLITTGQSAVHDRYKDL
jgi:hypothetical protein